MSSAAVIDALFERTIDIVQSLPKTGPIQTSYEEKLALYSLYKQATEGDVKGKRPGMLDMLGRAKWDAWAKRKGYASQEAKQLYVESLLKTLRKFSDRPQAIALIEELESFSGDVAERVMSASLARAGSDSSVSSGSLSPRVALHRGQAYSASEGEEDERDMVSQLPPRPTMSSRPSSNRAGPSMPLGKRLNEKVRAPASVDEVSSMAVRGGGGPASRLLRESDSDDEVPSRHAALPSQSSQQYATSRGPTSARGTAGQYSRGGPGSSSQQQDARFYAPATSQRFPAPPRSESIAGGGFQTGGAGASLYSAIGPSRPIATSEQHYYHHHGAEGGAGGASRAYAASSVGGRSGGGGASVRGPRPEVEMALQSIQASLAAVHERLNQVEAQSRTSSVGSMLFGANSPLGMGYQALANALHDIASLLGIARDTRGSQAAAPSFHMSGQSRDGKRIDTAGHGKGRGKGDASGHGRPDSRSGWSAIFRLVTALINLSIRLALDLTSVTVVFSLFVLIFKRVTGRGDPLFLFRLIQRYSGMIRAKGKRMVEEPTSIKLG